MTNRTSISKLAIAIGAGLLCFAPAAAQDETAPVAEVAPEAAADAMVETVDADPALWIAEDEDTKIYMFGTYHLLDGTSRWFDEAVKTAYDASDEIVLEAIPPENMAELQPLFVQYGVDTSGTPLSEKVPPETMEILRGELKTAGLPANAFDPLDPWFVNLQMSGLIAQKLSLTGENGPETVITAAARQEGKALKELEGFEYQIKLFDNMPLDQQVNWLNSSVEDLDGAVKLYGDMRDAWSEGDVDTLATMITEGVDEYPALFDLIFTNRNANWAEWIDTRLDTPGTVFLAVGAGHLAGRDSVQDFLQARGIDTVRIDY